MQFRNIYLRNKSVFVLIKICVYNTPLIGGRKKEESGFILLLKRMKMNKFVMLKREKFFSRGLVWVECLPIIESIRSVLCIDHLTLHSTIKCDISAHTGMQFKSEMLSPIHF